MSLTAEPKTEDRYVTRVTGEPGIFDRVEPTVWGDVQGPIDPATLAAHDARGYSYYDSLLSPGEVQAYRDELTRLAGDAALRSDERTVLDKASGEVRSIFEVHKLSPLIAELVRDPRVLDRARQILGSEVYVHQSRVNCLPAFQGTGVYWRSDFEAWHAEDGMPVPRAVSIAIALTENYPYNGGMLVMPGSQRSFVQCAGETPAEADIAAMAEKYGIDQFTGPAGSAMMFDANIMHGSGNNITPFPRTNIRVVFNSVENTLVEPYAAGSPRPSFLGARDFAVLHR